jgi:hypothetical protein
MEVPAVIPIAFLTGVLAGILISFIVALIWMSEDP